MKDIIAYIHESGTADMHALAKEYETADGSRKDTLLARLVHEAKSHAGRYTDADSMAIELIGKVDTFCKKNGYDTAELVKNA